MFNDILMQMQQQFQQFVDWSNQTAIQSHQQMMESHQRRMNSIDQCIDTINTEANHIYEEHVKRAAELEAANKAEYEKWSKEVEERRKKRDAQFKKNMAEAKALFEKRVAEMKVEHEKRVAEMKAAHENSDIVREVEAHFASMEK